MESYLQITQLNDFVFCPRSIYYSGVYRDSVNKGFYQHRPQVQGTLVHQKVDDGTYSSRRDVITGMMVFSEKYCLLGRIDILDMREKMLTERKYSVTAVYDGFRYQLYAQYYALQEMGFDVVRMRIHSLKDNRSYVVDVPGKKETAEFEELLKRIRDFSVSDPFVQNLNKCRNCIYRPLCDFYLDSGDADADPT